VAEGGKNEKKGGEIRCHLGELGLAGEVVGVEALAEVLVEVGGEAGLDGATPMPGACLAMVCLMVILTGDMDLLTRTMAMV